jgi:hypothetical protein
MSGSRLLDDPRTFTRLRDWLIEPEDDGCGDADGRHNCVGASFVAGVDAAPVLEFAGHVLDPVALSGELYRGGSACHLIGPEPRLTFKAELQLS